MLFSGISPKKTIKQIAKRAEELFGELFSEKLFRAQLSFHDDIDYSEPIEYISKSFDDADIKQYLVSKSLNFSETV